MAMFAAYQAMGKTPDIVSSSPVLAERDAKFFSAFYKELDITVDINTNKSKDGASHFSDPVKLVMCVNTSLNSLLSEKAKDARNILVRIRLSRFLEKDIPKILKREELFSVYLNVLDGVYEDDVFSDQRDVIVSSLH